MSNIRVDVLFKSVKDLQQEKSCLEQKLKELRNSRAKLEYTLENVMARHSQARDINAKMSEMSKVAQHKVVQTQSQVDKLEEMNQKKQSNLSLMNQEIENERNKQLGTTTEFQERLDALSRRFLEARDFYTRANLTGEISTAASQKKELDTKAGFFEREALKLRERIAAIKLDTEDKDILLARDEQRAVVELFTTENNAAGKVLDTLVDKLNSLKQKVATLREQTSIVLDF